MHQGQSAKDVLQLLEGGLIISGILLFILGITGLVHRILRLFTPLVTGTFLLILALQLSGVLLKGMMGLQGSATHPDYTTATIALFIFALITFLSIRERVDEKLRCITWNFMRLAFICSIRKIISYAFAHNAS